MSFLTPPIVFSKPSPTPRAMFVPTWSENTFDGELMPSKPFTPLTMPLKKPFTLSVIHPIMEEIPLQMPSTMLLPMLTIPLISAPMPLTIAEMICGNCATSCGMA